MKLKKIKLLIGVSAYDSFVFERTCFVVLFLASLNLRVSAEQNDGRQEPLNYHREGLLFSYIFYELSQRTDTL